MEPKDGWHLKSIKKNGSISIKWTYVHSFSYLAIYPLTGGKHPFEDDAGKRVERIKKEKPKLLLKKKEIKGITNMISKEAAAALTKKSHVILK